MDDGGYVGRHCPSVGSRLGVTGGGTRRDKSRRHTASMAVEYVRGKVSEVKCLVINKVEIPDFNECKLRL